MHDRIPPRLLVLGRNSLGELCSAIPSLQVTGVVASAEDALAAVDAGDCDVVLIDFNMPGAPGMERLRRIAGAASSIPIIVMIDDHDAALMSEAMSAGALGFVKPAATPAEIADAVQVVLAGGSYIDPARALAMVDELSGLKGEIGRTDGDTALSAREIEILTHLAEGRSARQIARELSVSERTVNTHVANLYRKLSVSNRVEAVREALRRGIVGASPQP